MPDESMPAEVRQFVEDHIGSVVHLEALLLLRSRPEESFTVEAVARFLYVGADLAAQALDRLVASGLLACPAPGSTFRYAPSTAELKAGADALAEVYRTRLVPLSRFIHERERSRGLHDFANAFRLRKD